MKIIEIINILLIGISIGIFLSYLKYKKYVTVHKQELKKNISDLRLLIYEIKRIMEDENVYNFQIKGPYAEIKFGIISYMLNIKKSRISNFDIKTNGNIEVTLEKVD